jgi:hypothetical protein
MIAKKSLQRIAKNRGGYAEEIKAVIRMVIVIISTRKDMPNERLPWRPHA